MEKETITETVTLAEAVKRLDTNLPRLTRLISKPPYAEYVRREVRPTKTGMRTVTLLSVSILDALKAELQERTGSDSEQKQKQDYSELLLQLRAENTRLWKEMTAQREARDQADSEFRRLLLSRDMEIVQLQGEVQKLLTSGPVTVEAEPTLEDTQESPSAPQTAQELAKVDERPPRRWWEVWK